jgi:predicted amidohydrolase YtcJ
MFKNWLFCLITCLYFTVQAQEKVDCIFYNAHIFSFETMQEVAQAMAVNQGKITALGSNQTIKNQYQAKQTINLNQAYVYPSWTDAHGHLSGLGIVASQPDLRTATSMQEILAICNKSAQNHTAKYIKGWGWNQENFSDKMIPSNDVLNQKFPTTPVFLKRVDGHAALVNQATLKLAGISDTCTRFGNLMVNVNGKATGLLYDAAADTVEKYLNTLDRKTQIAALLRAQSICFDYGIGMVHDAGIDLPTLHLIDSLQEVGLLKIRINAMLYLTDTAFAFLNKYGPIHKSKLQVIGFKLLVDGALGSRGACLKQPYSDQQHWYGSFLQSPDLFSDWIHRVASSPFQLSTHAIGDSANSFVITKYAQVLPKHIQRRWRIEHAQVLDSNLFPYLDGKNIIPSVQPVHAFSDHLWAHNRLGSSRMQYAYAYGKMLNYAGNIAIGTDFPVESPNPLQNYWAALGTFKDGNLAASNYFINSQQAFKGMTLWPAYAAFLENEMGELAKGKWADFTVYSSNLIALSANQLKDLKPIQLFIAGEKVK